MTRVVLKLARRPRPAVGGQSPAFAAEAERLRRAGDAERAAAVCRDGLARYPDHVSARVTLGWALIDLGRYDEALRELQSAHALAPDNLAATRGLAELADRQRGDGVLMWPERWDQGDAPEPTPTGAPHRRRRFELVDGADGGR